MRQDDGGGRGITRLGSKQSAAKAGDTRRCPRFGLDAWGAVAPLMLIYEKKKKGAVLVIKRRCFYRENAVETG